MGLLDPFSFFVVSAAIFAGAVVSGMVGFAFSAVAGAILLHVLPPTEAVPLMMACSVVPQVASLVALRRNVTWRGSAGLIAGGLIGIPPALYLLHHVDAHILRNGFGVFLVVYAAFMLLRPAVTPFRTATGRLRDAAVGFGGGLIGGLTAMPGALPTMWCDLRGLPKEVQRGLVQPYIAAMQVFALALMLPQTGFSTQALVDLTFALPALAAGSLVGILMFRRVNDAWFRSAVLLVLFFAGLFLAA